MWKTWHLSWKVQASWLLWHVSFSKSYWRQSDVAIDNFLINFHCHFGKLKAIFSWATYRELKGANLTSENERLVKATFSWATYRALKGANLALENERLVKATIGVLMLSTMFKQLKKMMHWQYYGTSILNIPSVMEKNEIDVGYNENNQVDSEIFYDCCSKQHHCFSSWCGSNINSRKRCNKNLPCSPDKHLNPLGPKGNSTKCFTHECKFQWAYNSPYAKSSRNNQKDNKRKNSQCKCKAPNVNAKKEIPTRNMSGEGFY